MGNLTNLQALYLSYNQLSGGIPPQFGNLSSLRYLFLCHNQLEGPLPHDLINLDLLEMFTFCETQLCEPQDAAFQAWLASIPYVERSGLICPVAYAPICVG